MSAEKADYRYRGEYWCHTCLEHLMGAEWIEESLGNSTVKEPDRDALCDQKGCEAEACSPDHDPEEAYNAECDRAGEIADAHWSR